MNYIPYPDINVCTHWLSEIDPVSVVKDYIIPNKFYELFKMKDSLSGEEEIFILSEDGCYSTYYLTHKGKFVIMGLDN